jgi:glycosyltransferase involved in cell wall biosynthesis
MPAYNAEKYIHEAIQSVINQEYTHWRLIIINDGSADSTEEVVTGFNESRIVYCRLEKNTGVSAARNVGLSKIIGRYLCFLDADDVMPPNSLSDRVLFLENNRNVDFVDGLIYVTGNEITDIKKVWTPAFSGSPARELIRLRDRCFVTISWMMRVEVVTGHHFQEDMSHGEDLVFLAEISPRCIYGFVTTPILYYRRRDGSAMTDLDGLAKGYFMMFETLKRKKLFATATDRYVYKLRMIRIMFLSYSAAGKHMKALNFIVKGIAV